MIDIIKVTAVAPQTKHQLAVTFSDGLSGVLDFANMIAEGGLMVEPLQDEAFFRRVFIEFGVLAWPNGFDIDAIALHRDMKKLGLLARAA
jgi:Protein of unknown function (DUF2442)